MGAGLADRLGRLCVRCVRCLWRWVFGSGSVRSSLGAAYRLLVRVPLDRVCGAWLACMADMRSCDWLCSA